MEVDIRLPMGFMFSILGALLVLFGLFTSSDTELYAPSLGINVNLWSGLIMLAFGGLMLMYALRAKKAGKKEQS
jgi:membrane-bound ClpP family serine protease